MATHVLIDTTNQVISRSLSGCMAGKGKCFPAKMHWATWITHVYLRALQGKSGNNTTRLLTPWQPCPGVVMAPSKYPANDPWRVTWLLHPGYSGERSIEPDWPQAEDRLCYTYTFKRLYGFRRGHLQACDLWGPTVQVTYWTLLMTWSACRTNSHQVKLS